jgi:preprotein translocase subunit YajC
MGAASPMFMMLLMFGVFYFILIRPQAKKQKEHQAMLSAIAKGDQIVTRGGLIGTGTGIQDHGAVLVVEMQAKVRIRVLRSHVDGKYDPKASVKDSKDDKEKAA